MIKQKAKRQKADERRPDHIYHKILTEAPLLHKHCQAAFKEMRLARASAFRLATEITALTVNHFDWLLQQIKSEKGLSQDPYDAWLQKIFGPYAKIDDYYRLLEAIKKGMTRKQYLAMTPEVFLAKKKRVARDHVREPVVSPAPTPNMSIEEQVMLLSRQNTELRAKLKETHAAWMSAERRAVRLERQINKLHQLTLT